MTPAPPEIETTSEPASSEPGDAADIATTRHRSLQPEPGRPGSPDDMTDAVDIRAVTYRYPKATADALHDITLTLAPGELFAILGPNGGGKSTLFRILATLLRPDTGSIRILGHDVATHPDVVRQTLGVVFQHPSVDLKLTAAEHMAHAARLFGLRASTTRPRADTLLQRLGLADRRHDRVGTFSGGMRRRLEIAAALLHHPRLLLMDEPTAGLDVAGRRELWTLIDELRRESHVTVLFTTHLMDEAERADRLAVLAGGRLLAVETPEALRSRLGGEVVTLQPVDPADAPAIARQVRDRLGPWTAGGEPRAVEGVVRCESVDGPALMARVGGAAGLLNGRLARMSVGRPTLEDALIHLTQLPSDG